MARGIFKNYVQVVELASVLEWIWPEQRNAAISKVLCTSTLEKLMQHYEVEFEGSSLEMKRDIVISAIDRKKKEEAVALAKRIGKDKG